jgi:hypothetical protein
LFLLCSRSNVRDEPKETESVLKKIFDSTSIRLHNIWHIFASDISWLCFLIYISWLFAFRTTILFVTLFIDPHFYSTCTAHRWSLRTKWGKNIWPKRKRKEQGSEENPIKRSSVIGTRHQVIVGWYTKDNNVNRTWSVHLEMKNVRVLVAKFAGQHVARPSIGERIILKWVLNWYRVKTRMTYRSVKSSDGSLHTWHWHLGLNREEEVSCAI